MSQLGFIIHDVSSRHGLLSIYSISFGYISKTVVVPGIQIHHSFSGGSSGILSKKSQDIILMGRLTRQVPITKKCFLFI